jgi:hypothetical protein
MVVRPCAVALLCLLTLSVGNAEAEVGYPTPTVQAVAADATWLAYAPAPAHPGIVCMVDSGVDPNPDTETAVIGGQAIASETDTLDEVARLEPRVQPGNHPDGHGTLMAMMMAAPVNGWGMVGIAPTSVRVYNMKALPKGQATFPFDYYAVAIEACQRLRAQSYTYMSVINLSLGGEATPGHSELVALENYVATAQRAGLAVVAAAGNDGGPVLYPAAYPPILSVGAGEVSAADGTLCVFASRGEGLDLIAPGCDSQTRGLEGVFEDDGAPAVGSGSSQASALVSAVLASMRAYAPQLTFMRAEECIVMTSKSGLVDVAQAFEACGLSQIVTGGKAAEASAASSSQSTDPGSTTTNSGTAVGAMCIAASCGQALPLFSRTARHGVEASCPPPRIVERARHRKRLVLRVGGHPTSCRLQARWRTKRGPRLTWIAITSRLPDVLRASPPAGFRELQIRYRGEAGRRMSSPWEAVHVG